MFSAVAQGDKVAGLHLAVESSEETISEAQRLSEEICQMLLAAGYFRARIPTLPAFDKMLGWDKRVAARAATLIPFTLHLGITGFLLLFYLLAEGRETVCGTKLSLALFVAGAFGRVCFAP